MLVDLLHRYRRRHWTKRWNALPLQCIEALASFLVLPELTHTGARVAKTDAAVKVSIISLLERKTKSGVLQRDPH